MQRFASSVGVNSAMSKVYGLTAMGLFVAALVAFFVASSPAMMALVFGSALKWVVLLAPLALVFVMGFGYERLSVNALTGLYFTLTALTGASGAALLHVFTLGSVAGVFVTKSLLFGVMSFVGYTTKADLTSMGKLLFFALIGLIIAMIVNMFLASSLMSTVISCVGVLIFVGLIAYDTQKLKSLAADDEKGAVMGALSLFLDFYNLFLFLLDLMGVKSND